MISDLKYAIEWLETARETGTRRTISNRSRYQRTSLLAEIEKLSYLAVKGQNLSYAKAGEILGVSKASVQSYVNRAQDKIDNQVKYGSQNILFDFLEYEQQNMILFK